LCLDIQNVKVLRGLQDYILNEMPVSINEQLKMAIKPAKRKWQVGKSSRHNGFGGYFIA